MGKNGTDIPGSNGNQLRKEIDMKNDVDIRFEYVVKPDKTKGKKKLKKRIADTIKKESENLKKAVKQLNKRK